jgi:RNA polymerase sigma-70 factor (ECF subfamily)
MSDGLGSSETDARGCDTSVLSGLYEEYFDKIARYAYVRIGVKADAEDIAGEVFLRALESIKSYRERGVPIQAWLFRIAHNLVVDNLRKKQKIKTVPIEDVQIESGANPAMAAERRIELERVIKAMGKLSQIQKEVLGLRFFGGLTSRETGQVLKKSDGAIREMQRAAIEKLRNLLSADV